MCELLAKLKFLLAALGGKAAYAKHSTALAFCKDLQNRWCVSLPFGRASQKSLIMQKV